MEFLHVGQAGLKLPISGDPPASASQSARMTGVSHRTWPEFQIFKCILRSFSTSVREPFASGECCILSQALVCVLYLNMIILINEMWGWAILVEKNSLKKIHSFLPTVRCRDVHSVGRISANDLCPRKGWTRLPVPCSVPRDLCLSSPWRARAEGHQEPIPRLLSRRPSVLFMKIHLELRPSFLPLAHPTFQGSQGQHGVTPSEH